MTTLEIVQHDTVREIRAAVLEIHDTYDPIKVTRVRQPQSTAFDYFYGGRYLCTIQPQFEKGEYVGVKRTWYDEERESI